MKVGVIGTGHWGGNLVRNLAALEVLAGVADPLEVNRAKSVADAPGIETFESAEELLAAGYDAVAIATPAGTHFEIGRQALEAGIDVFVEKPMTLDPEEARCLHEQALASERILMVGHLLLYQPAIAFIADYLQAGKLGKVYTMHQRRSKLGRVRDEENVMWSFGVHDVAVLLTLAGEMPTEVLACGHAAITPDIEDDTYLHLGFASGVKAHLHNSWLWPRIERELLIVGERGMLVFDEPGSRVVLHRKTVDGELIHRDEGEEILFEGSGQPLRLELEHFLECCRERKTPVSDGRNGYEVVKVIDKAEKLLAASR
ncbi:MAG: Gfo/Idh/MocA family oxidoreductase [Roseibacillus sp.]|nr:Gfo/Idh/MocA family oxidoreductase [Roseibacillus sp.]